MGYAIYRIGNGRWGGYGVPAYCEHPDCDKEIDRGMAFACGGEPFSELGCDGYFCEDHREYYAYDSEQDGPCEHDEDCLCPSVEVCHACATGQPRYPYKQEHPRFIYHLVHDYSWAEWRNDKAEKVAALIRELGDYKPPKDDDDTQENES